MSRDFPNWIDVGRAAQAGRRFAGQARLEWMPRVLDLLDSPAAEDAIAFEIAASCDEQNVARLDVHVHGEVPMICQRTLKRYWQAIDSAAPVAVVADEAMVAGLPENLEPKIAPEGRVRLVDLVEDELLLALPLVPRDPDSAPVDDAGGGFGDGPGSEAGEQEPRGPFAELARLRKGSGRGKNGRKSKPRGNGDA